MSVPYGAVTEEGFFSAMVGESDPEIADAIGRELGRQRDEIELIASENIVSRAVLEAQGSVLTNKYAEGLPGKRYYGGCQFVDVVERLAIERVTKLFGCAFANVQPHSGASANAEVFMALMQPGDTFMGLNLAAGGHLTHGSPVNLSGRWFKPVPYGVRPRRPSDRYGRGRAAGQGAPAEGDHHRRLGLSAHHRFPSLPRRSPTRSAPISWSIWRISQAWSPAACIRARSRMPMWSRRPRTRRCAGRAAALSSPTTRISAKKLNSAVFPGMQGGPLMHVIAAKAVAFGEALAPLVQALRQERGRECQGAGGNAEVLAVSILFPAAPTPT